MQYYRRVIRITAEDSPNVKYAREQIRHGIEPNDTMLIPGVLSWDEYQKRLATWDEIRISIGLRAQFYEGAALRLYPQQWLDSAEVLHRTLFGRARRARGVGVDPAEGGDRTSMSAVDRLGVMAMLSVKTPDTNEIPKILQAFLQSVGGSWDDVTFDGGGGGKQIADMLRGLGKKVRIVRFGEGVSLELKRGISTFTQKREVREDQAMYVNRRAQLYGTLAELIDPRNPMRFALLPSNSCEEANRLRTQLSVIPKLYDQEDRLMLPPKRRKAGQKANVGLKSLEELIGYSPDEADSLVLAADAMLTRLARPKAGVS